MKFLFSLLLMLLFVGGKVTFAQQLKKSIPLDSLRASDSLSVFKKGSPGDQLAGMPIYNPGEVDARIMVLRPPAEPVDPMPILGRKDSSKALIPIPDLSKHPLKQWPPHIYGKQKDKPAKHE